MTNHRAAGWQTRKLIEQHTKAQKIIEDVSRELTNIDRAMRKAGLNPTLGYALDRIAEAYMLHEDFINSCYIYPKEEGY
jgi:hypothetical protein